MSNVTSQLGLYIHIPFCSHLCHYCDFPKTARWDGELARQYFAALKFRLKLWLDAGLPNKLVSINFGGGTPSLFAEEYRPLLEMLKPHINNDCEISLEANPEDITQGKLTSWKKLGFNRLSIGVQSFSPAGLKFLTRKHNEEELHRSLTLARKEFENFNLDLIYAWPGQTKEIFESDLVKALTFDPSHLSLYCLSFPPKTPIGRAYERGKITPLPDSLTVSFYEKAREGLRARGFIHDEVSNWTKPNFTCVHNWLYWQGGSYLGLGCGAHSFLPHENIGRRFHYQDRIPGINDLSQSKSADPFSDPQIVIEERNEQDWLYEYVGAGLRCRLGLDLWYIKEKSGYDFVPSPEIESALHENKMQLSDGIIALGAKEWIRESAWCVKLLDCFK